jgi:hypothetical protein
MKDSDSFCRESAKERKREVPTEFTTETQRHRGRQEAESGRRPWLLRVSSSVSIRPSLCLCVSVVNCLFPFAFSLFRVFAFSPELM